MKGNNTLMINTETMIDMVQHYLNDHMLSKEHQVEVTGVTFDFSNKFFTVETSEPQMEIQKDNTCSESQSCQHS